MAHKPSAEAQLDCWGQWWARRHYSLQVVQHPLRARMCGFGDKDRRPLAPAAVAKMVVRREDSSIVDADDVDSAFFLVTVDLWSADGKREMNLVLHPSSSTDRHVSAVSAKQKKPRGAMPSTHSPLSDHPSPTSSQSTPNSAPELHRPPLDPQPVVTTIMPTESSPGFTPSGYSYTPPEPVPDAMPYPGPAAYNPSPDPPNGWSYPHTVAHSSHALQNQPLRNAQRSHLPPTSSDTWNNQSTYRADAEPTAFRAWPGAESSYQTPSHSQPPLYHSSEIDPSSRTYHPTAQPDGREYNQWNQSQQDAYPVNYDLYGAPPYPQQSPQTPYYQANYAPSNASSSSSSPRPTPRPLPRHIYTRTLVGPLSSNACRLLDEHQTPGIFFLFQDLSVRTEGTFRLRLRLMNVGECARLPVRQRKAVSPTPDAGAVRVHTNTSPVLAQTFTDPFVVFSAKRFPGVPETTALSIAFGNQGQKLPLRNRHGTGKHGRRPLREGDSEGSESSDDT